MHDDQHGTAIISAAGLLNALKIAGKKIEDVRIVVNGAGAAANSCTKLYMALGAKLENIVMLDSKGVINTKRTDLNDRKKPFATSRDISTLAEAVAGADVFLGLSVKGVLTKEMVRSMNENPIVFALANPEPEISYEDAMESRPDIIFASGRSDHPNQINNVLGFPYIFRGALDVRAKCINEEMKLAAVKAIAELTHRPVPDVVNAAYNLNKVTFSRDYFIPKALDPRLITVVAPAVAKAAIESGVARKTITDWDAYDEYLKSLMGRDNKLLRRFYDAARRAPKKVVFSEADHVNMLKAAELAQSEGLCTPVLLGNEERLAKIAKENGIDISGMEIVNLRHDREEARRSKFAKMLSSEKGRDGFTYNVAYEKMFERNYFGMMMVKTGEADAMITGVYGRFQEAMSAAQYVIGLREGLNHSGAMHIVNTKKGIFFMADTLINRHPDTETLIDIAKLTYDTVKFFAHNPVMAMLSYSNFGSDNEGTPMKVRKAVETLHKNYPDMVVDGEMQLNFAVNNAERDKNFPFSRLYGKEVNTLVFPNLSSGNMAYKLMLEMGVGEIVGPIQMGLNKPIHFLDVQSSVRDIVNLTAIAVLDAQVEERKSAMK